MRTFVKFTVICICAGLICACGKKDEDKPAPLSPAYVEVAAADLALIFRGEAEEQTVNVTTNREITATASAAWVTTEVAYTKTADKVTAATLKVKVSKSDAAKKRSATLTLASVLANATDKLADNVPTISLSQGVAGLPEADLLDVVFDANGDARDISVTKNTIYKPRSFELGITAGKKTVPAINPAVSMNTAYGRNTAKFEGTSCGYRHGLEIKSIETNEHGQVTKTDYFDKSCWLDPDNQGARLASRGGNCFYRVDYVDYSNVKTAPDDGSSQPYNAIGKAFGKAYSLEVICKWDDTYDDIPNHFRRSYPFGATQNGGTGIIHDGDDDGKGFAFAVNYKDGASNKDQKLMAAPGGGFKTDPNHYYHIIGTYDNSTHKAAIYVDGIKTDEATLPGDFGYVNQGKTEWQDAMAQFFLIGADACQQEPYNNGGGTQLLKSGLYSVSERAFKGEIVVCRIYGKALNQSEVTTLYNYEKPE